MTKVELTAIPCPTCKGIIDNVLMEEESITQAKRVPILVTAKCPNGHSVILFVDSNLSVRDFENAGTAEHEKASSVDKAQKWMDSI